MRRQFLLACVLLCLTTAGARAGKKDDAAREALRTYNENKQAISGYKYKHGKALYVGEGVAEIKQDADLGRARELAKGRALADMLSSIRVRVKAVVLDEIKYSSTAGTSEKVERLIESYVDQVLSVVRDDYYLDYPRPGDITVIAYVSRSAYDESIARDLQAKTDKVRGYAAEGAKAQAARQIGRAIENYVNGKTWLDNYFHELPVKAEIRKNADPEDLGAYFDTRLTQVLSSIKLEAAQENIVYNTAGKVSRKPVVFFSYEDRAGKVPLPDMPAKAAFARGTGAIGAAPLRSGRRGEIYIPLDRVDPAEREATVQVELDAAAFRLKDSQAVPVVFIPVRKSRAVAWAVNFFNGESRERPAALADGVKQALTAAGYELKAFDIPGAEITDRVVAAARRLNVDYIVYACATASGAADEYGMFKSGASSKAYIYSFYDDRLVEAAEGPSGTGYSTTAGGAAQEALARLKPGLLAALKEKISALK